MIWATVTDQRQSPNNVESRTCMFDRRGLTAPGRPVEPQLGDIQEAWVGASVQSRVLVATSGSRRTTRWNTGRQFFGYDSALRGRGGNRSGPAVWKKADIEVKRDVEH